MSIKNLITTTLIFLIFLIFSCKSSDKTSEPTNRKKVLYVNLGIYTPGTKLAFGDPLQASKIIADKYTELHPEITIKFVQQVVISGSQEGEWLKTQLVGGIAPDIISIMI